MKTGQETLRGPRSSAGQKKRDQRNEKYFPGAFAFAWLAQNDGTARCNVASTSKEGVRSIETGEESSQQVRRLLEAHRTAGQVMKERINRTEASVRDTSQAGGSAARAQEAPGADDGRFRFGAFSTRYQPENSNGEDTGWRDWSRVFRTWAGRFQRG